MMTLSVWAPQASSMQAVVGKPGWRFTDIGQGFDASSIQREMRPLNRGWWQITFEDSGPVDYGFRVDGGPLRPDPRSAWQPHGVHDVSRTFDPHVYTWKNTSWGGMDARGAVIYELHVGTFTPGGTLDSAAAKLPYLSGLGVDMVQLLPVAAFNGRWGWGYDGVGLYAVHHEYGGPEALQRFVDTAHGHGMGVALDVVYNHLGPSGNYLGEFGPYFTDQHSTPWGDAMNLDADHSSEVRAFLCDNAARWFRDFGVDALRLDAVHALMDDSEEHVLALMSRHVADLSDALGRPLSLIAESDLNDATMVTPVAEGGLGMTAQWNDDVHHALHAATSGERHGYYADFGSLATVAHVLERVFFHAGTWSSFREQQWGAPVDRAAHDGHRFVAYTQTHDQVGNRAAGDRPSSYLSPGLLAIRAAVVLLSPFTPMVFMGEEWGAADPWQFFVDHSEPELAEAVREGRLAEFARHGWDAADVPDPTAPETFERSVLNWGEPEQQWRQQLLQWYTELIAVRKATPDLTVGDLRTVRVTFDESQRWLMMQRGSWCVAANFGEHDVTVEAPEASLEWTERLSWGSAASEGGKVSLGSHACLVMSTTPLGEESELTSTWEDRDPPHRRP